MFQSMHIFGFAFLKYYLKLRRHPSLILFRGIPFVKILSDRCFAKVYLFFSDFVTMGRPKGRKVSPAEASRRYREKSKNKVKIANYERKRCEERKIERLKIKLGEKRIVKMKFKQVV